MQPTYFFAEVASGASEKGLLEVLGIDWKLLLLQGIAFLILVWFLGKFVYPILIKAIDDRQAKIEESTQAAARAEAKAAESEEKINALLKEARKQADGIVETAHKEAAAMVADAEAKAKKRAEHIVSEAGAQLEKDVAAARKALKDETVELVAMATEKIIRQKIDRKSDAALIREALQEVR